MIHRAGSVDAATPLDDIFVVDPVNGNVYLLTGSEAEMTRRVLAHLHSGPSIDEPTGHAVSTCSDTERPVLGPREATILQLVADGHSNETIASMLHYSVATVRRSISSLYQRLGARNRASAIARAHELKLLT